MFFALCFIQTISSQEGEGAIPLDLPVRNSMTFNRFVLNPTFSFVREQNKFIAISNKRELQQVENAPVTYLASFSGRIQENMGVGIGAFQQNFGVLTTFGGIANFAYNAQLQRESNLTFGINVAAYQSGVNMDRVVTNQPDPVLNNIPSNFMFTATPGVNYGTAFFDFGISVNNLVAYNVNASTLLEDDPQQGIQGHIMYTGYTGGYGFFRDSKFSALGQAAFRQETTELTGSIMFTVPRGIWSQAGYNSIHGAFVGLGINLTKEIAIEYNFEKPLGDFSEFGVTHEFTLAYRFANNDYFDFSKEEDMAGLLSFEKKRKKSPKRKKQNLTQEEETALTAAREEQRAKNSARKQAWEAAMEERKQEAAQKEKEQEALAEAQLAAEQAAATEAIAQQEEERLAQLEAEEQARFSAEQKALAEAQEKVRLEAERLAQLEAEEQARLAAEQKALAEAQEKARLEAEEKARLEAERLAQLEAEEQARLAAEQKALAEAQEKARLEAEEQARLEAERLAQLEAEEKARLAAEQRALAAAQEKARLEAERLAQLEAAEQARLAAEQEQLAQTEPVIEATTENTLAQYTDALATSMKSLLEETQSTAANKNDLLQELRDAVAIKDQDLKDLKRENDLSEQGIFSEPKPFKSITEENAAIDLIKINLDEVILTYRKKIEELEALYQQRFAKEGGIDKEFNLYYQNALSQLQAELQAAQREKAQLVSSLQEIAVATDIERKRRIKRAAYNNEDDRFRRDRSTLNSIKQTTEQSSTPLSEADFNFGEAQKSNNVQILKNVANTENGYYLVMAVHNSAEERNTFLRKVIAAGYSGVDFFYDVSRSKYYTYYQRIDRIEDANRIMEAQKNEPFNKQLSLYKIEN